MRKILLYIHQLPQNILGLIVILFTRAKYCKSNCWVAPKGSFGVSLGKYIILGSRVNPITLKHEQGHQKQSVMFGWLYLLVIGIPSLSRNIWDIFAHSRWTNEERIKWYYGGFPEKQADAYMGIKR
jgi:hypothetical protein